MSTPQNPVAHQRRSMHRATSLLMALLFGLISVACQSESSGGSGPPDTTGMPVANFTQDQTSGLPGTTIQFSDASTGEVAIYAWDFGALGTSSDQNPAVTFTNAGVYSIGLTVSGPNGTSNIMKPTLIAIGDVTVAGFTCTPTSGFAPLIVSCDDASTGANALSWDFGDGSTSSDTSVTHVYSAVGSYTIELTASGAGTPDQASQLIEVLPFGISITPADPGSNAAPSNVTLTAVTGGLSGFYLWTIDGEIASIGASFLHRFSAPGTFTIELTFATGPPAGISSQASIEHVVTYGPPNAEFVSGVAGDDGAVTMSDRSSGAIDLWEWNFGDGSQCIYPLPGSLMECDSSSPTHAYQSAGLYDVSLTVTGPAEDPSDPAIVSSTAIASAARVYIIDPSFEFQTANSGISFAWQGLRPMDALEAAQHIALSDSIQADAGMPTSGSQWAVLDGLGTDGATAADVVNNGIQQTFLRPTDRPVLEFDYALLYAEPPASLTLDAMTATVSDGSTTVEISSARANVSTPYVGPSTIYPTSDGAEVRVTPVQTASINLLEEFSGSTDSTEFTLTIRITNAVNELRSPRAYVDNIRFVEEGTPLVANFTLATSSAVAGQPANFINTLCPDPDADPCIPGISWRWDFDTHDLATPPAASGSGDQNPAYTFAEAGDYLVQLIARQADLESSFTRLITVIEAPIADFSFAPTPMGGGTTAPNAEFSFIDLSTFDPTDPIATWSWDFSGWGVSSLPNPDPVTIGQAGSWLMRLTITTDSGQVNTAQATLIVD